MKSSKSPRLKVESQGADVARRAFVAAAAPLLWLGWYSTDAVAAACFDLESLPSSQKRLRRSLGFRLATDEQQRCSSCAFFTAGSGDCGTCRMLGDAATSTAYVCDSWAIRR